MSGTIMNLILALKGQCALADEKIRTGALLSPSEHKGLLCISPDETLSAAALSEKMGLSASRGSRVIEKMLKSGYLVRKQGTDDRRSVCISLSKKGRDLRKKVQSLMEKCEARIRAQFTESELKDIEETLGKLIKAL
jgi:DNA-binding MarR family transcriptional regulator